MAAASQKPFAGHIKKKVHGALCTVIFMVLLDRSVLLMAASIHAIPGYTRLIARIGEDVKIPFEFCLKDIMPSCTVELTFNLSAPNSACTVDRHGHCQISVAPGDHPGRERLDNGCELCELTIQPVTQEDIGQYAICLLPECRLRNISFLNIENDATPTSSTSATTTTAQSGMSDFSSYPSEITKNRTKKGSEIIFVPGTEEPQNDPQTCMRILTAVGIPGGLAINVIVIVIIGAAVYLYKKRSRRRQFELVVI